MKDYKEKYIKCDCCAECSVLKITEVPLYTEDKKVDYMIHMCIYKCRQNKFPLVYKLRLIWNIIRYGEPYDDDIVISKKDASNLSCFLDELELEYDLINRRKKNEKK
jgi:hypothetical protein